MKATEKINLLTLGGIERVVVATSGYLTTAEDVNWQFQEHDVVKRSKRAYRIQAFSELESRARRN
jgi:hypothetical protein